MTIFELLHSGIVSCLASQIIRAMWKKLVGLSDKYFILERLVTFFFYTPCTGIWGLSKSYLNTPSGPGRRDNIQLNPGIY